jgi:hypothetical protein
MDRNLTNVQGKWVIKEYWKRDLLLHPPLCMYVYMYIYIYIKLHGLSPLANYKDGEAADCRRS